MAAASIALATVTSTGILVCNCSDEFGRDGWINVAGTNLILICFFVSKTKLKNTEFRHRGVWFVYEFLSFFAVMLIVFSGPSTIHDTSKFDSAPSNFHISDFNQSTTTTKTTTTMTTTMTTTTKKWPFPSSLPTTTRPKPTLPSLSFPTLPGRTLDRCQKRFDIWNYCLGMCNKNGEVEFWDCVRWENYPDQMASWDHPVPVGIRLARFWFIMSVCFAVITFQKIKSREENVRSFILGSMLFCGISANNIYGFNMVQSSTVIPGRFEENLPFNAHCSVGGFYSIICAAALFGIIFFVDSILLLSAEKPFTKNDKLEKA